MKGSPRDQNAGRQANAADIDPETVAKSIGEVASPLLAGFSFTNVIVIIVSSNAGYFLLPGEAIISWTIASIAFVLAVQFAKWVARKKVNYERTVLFYHIGVVTFLLGFGFALAPEPSSPAYWFRCIASGVAFAFCAIEAGVYVNRALRDRHPIYPRRLGLVKNTYPVRLSTDELRQELDAYLEARESKEKAPTTIDLDRRKVRYFLDWLDSGELR